MPVVPANLGYIAWGGSHPGSFRPIGPVFFYGDRSVFDRDSPHRNRNPVTRQKAMDTKVAAIRFFIGFNVNNEPRWTMKDLEKLVITVRQRQLADPSATFVGQRGIYQHRDTGGKTFIVTEDGAQLVIMNMAYWQVPIERFKEQMEELGEEICQQLQQEMVLAEWQINGLTEENWEVTPPPAKSITARHGRGKGKKR